VNRVRPRRQTTLTFLAKELAGCNHELAVCEALLAKFADVDVAPGLPELLARRQELLGHREALSMTLKQFDPAIEAGSIHSVGGGGHRKLKR
jgi:hypothetical protein